MENGVWLDSPAGSLQRAMPVTVERHEQAVLDGLVTEHFVTVMNHGDTPVELVRVDSLRFPIGNGDWELLYFTSRWGEEFAPVRLSLQDGIKLCNQTGRSSNGMHPWCSLFHPDGRVLTLSVMWSGDWVMRFEQMTDGTWLITAGVDEVSTRGQVLPGGVFESPHVAAVWGSGGDMNTTSVLLARAGREVWYPKTRPQLLVEWNHWWSYEDKAIDEATFRHNVDVAAELGFDICTLDAGWFGPSGETHWFLYRGDWDVVHRERFPSGIRALSDYTHKKGLRFGLWCEIEAVGEKAKLGREHPDYLAMRDGRTLGYACFGNSDVQEWACRTLGNLIEQYQCDWIKLDFNLDVSPGCNSASHGHGPGEGLLAHYWGYYKVLDRIRARYPQVTLENCASGGLRIDLEMAQHTHLSFLSDVDFPEHNLQVFWGASTMLAPSACLHWGYSDWRYSVHPKQKFNPHDDTLNAAEIDYFLRTSMLSAMGFSQRLPELPKWIRSRYIYHIDLYKRLVARFVRQADCYRLTEQPLRDGTGARWAAFQYVMPELDEHLLFVFRLPGATANFAVHLRELETDAFYLLTSHSFDGERAIVTTEERQGSQLMRDGLVFDGLAERESCLLHIVKKS